MKKWTVWALALLLLAACEQAPVARITGTVENAKDSAVVLQKLNFNRLVPVDTIRTDAAGNFSYKVKLTGKNRSGGADLTYSVEFRKLGGVWYVSGGTVLDLIAQEHAVQF